MRGNGVVDAAGGGQRTTASNRLLRGYGLASGALTALYAVLPEPWRGIDVLVVSAGAVACVGYGRRAVRRDRRRPWTLLLGGLVVIVAASVVLLMPDERATTAGRLIDASGNLLLLAAGLSLIFRRGASDLGGVIDAAVIAFAAGSLLWAVLPHRIGPDDSFAAQVSLFVVVFALTGILGALLRLSRTAAEPISALRWLLAAIGLAIAGNVALAIAGSRPETAGNMLFLAAFTATGLFGIDPTGPRLMRSQKAPAVERLSFGRLAFLGAAVAVIPVIVGARDLLDGDLGGLLLTVQGTLVAVLVMLRIGLLSAQRARAEEALEHQAAHDALTHLPNRREFVARLADELSRSTRCLVLFCDLDDFKVVNDRFGHDVGDRLLIDVAHRLRSCIGPPHMVSRFGGDEFVILLVGATLADDEPIRACIAAELARPFESAGGTTVAVSIGVSPVTGERDPEALIRSADRAMYEAKASGGSPPGAAWKQAT